MFSFQISVVNKTPPLTKNVLAIVNAKQKHLGCKKVWGQSEATLQTGRHDQKV